MDQKGFFSQKPATNNEPDPRILDEIGQVTRRVKLLESTIETLRSTIQSLEQNFVREQKESRRDIKVLEEENNELKDSVRTTRDTMKLIVQDIRDLANKQDVEIIKRYLDMWNPVHFITREQMEKRLEEERQDNIHKQGTDI
jgi:predicted  nucleic acid-binding Zn-ribbon protein